MYLQHLKTLHMVNPIGIDIYPYFSWIIKSEEQSIIQTAYRIIVSAGAASVWDTGKVESDQSAYVEYKGKPLESRTVYSWTVTAWDNKGNEASAAASFETALLEKSDWKAKWAESALPRGKSKIGFGKQPPATMFRKAFTLQSEVKHARLYATCHGIYRLTVNGNRPDDREFAPEHTSYGKYLCYQTYDVTHLLRAGKNALGMYVGDGWYNGPITKPNIKGFKRRPAVLFQLEIEYADGSKATVISDADVQTAYGPVEFSDLFAGEKYDATKENPGWDSPAFAVDSKWINAAVTNFGVDNLVAQLGQPVRPVLELPAKAVLASPRGETIVDFGQVLAGRVRMRVNAPKGAIIELDHFEVLDKDGNYFNNLASDKKEKLTQHDVYIADGKEKVYEPLFTFHGFRYVKVTGLNDACLDDFTAVVLSTEMDDVGTFECSDPRLNRLYENTRWSQRSNMISIPTDCPQREKAGWTGDIQIYATTALHNADATPLLTRWLYNVACDQGENGAVPLVVPYDGFYPTLNRITGILFGNKGGGVVGQAGWGDAAVHVPFAMYQVTGNTEILRQQYDSMKKWCGYVIDMAKNQRGKNKLPKEVDQYLWNTGFHWGEWLIPSLSKAGFGKDTLKSVRESRNYIAPIFAYYAMTNMTEIAKTLKKQADEVYYRDMAAKIKDAFARGMIDENGDMPYEYMGAYVLPICFDLVPEPHKKHFADKLVRLIEQNGGCLDTGFLATPYILDALCKIGRQDLAYTILYQEKCPSWLYEVKMGATSIWESWNGYQDNGQPTRLSFNHYAFGCVDDWMFRTICGINKTQPGYKHIVIRPQQDASLTFAKRTFASEFGDIVCNWARKDGEFHLEVIIPCNTTADIVLPNGQKHQVGSGSYSYIC